MSGSLSRIPRSQALAIAERFIELLDGTTERLLIAGSIRRGLPTAGDIEVCAVPIVQPMLERDMFGEVVATAHVDLLDARLTTLLDNDVVQKRLRSDGRTFWGPKAKYLLFEGFPIDLFTPERDRWGVIVTIRTGPATYSHMLVTEAGKQVVVGRDQHGRPQTRIGRLPAHLRVHDGWLQYRVSGQRIPTPEERDFYREIGVPYVDPHERH